MGDVLGITEANGNLIAQYLYDEWGKLLSIDTADEDGSTAYREIAEANPLRYRGYYYDNETGYYYLQSRYYDSDIGRFINADVSVEAKDNKDKPLGFNLFLYCYNEPTNCYDADGHVSVYLKNKKISNVIVKFARWLNPTWTISSSVKSQKKVYINKLGVTFYLGASSSTSLTAMKNNVSSNNRSVKVSNNCSLSFGKRKLSYSASTTYKNNTVKGTVAVGTNSLCYGISVISKYYYNSNSACYFSIDIGFGIKHITTLGATAVVAAVCIAVPYIAPAVGKIYTNVILSATSYSAYIKYITTIAASCISVATNFVKYAPKPAWV